MKFHRPGRNYSTQVANWYTHERRDAASRYIRIKNYAGWEECLEQKRKNTVPWEIRTAHRNQLSDDTNWKGIWRESHDFSCFTFRHFFHFKNGRVRKRSGMKVAETFWSLNFHCFTLLTIVSHINKSVIHCLTHPLSMCSMWRKTSLTSFAYMSNIWSIDTFLEWKIHGKCSCTLLYFKNSSLVMESIFVDIGKGFKLWQPVFFNQIQN